MHIRHLEYIFSIDKVVPVDLFPVFDRYYYNAIYPGAFFRRSHKFPYQSLLLSTTVLNDYASYPSYVSLYLHYTKQLN